MLQKKASTNQRTGRERNLGYPCDPTNPSKKAKTQINIKSKKKIQGTSSLQLQFLKRGERYLGSRKKVPTVAGEIEWEKRPCFGE